MLEWFNKTMSMLKKNLYFCQSLKKQTTYLPTFRYSNNQTL